jgi:hypothetical protein
VTRLTVLTFATVAGGTIWALTGNHLSESGFLPVGDVQGPTIVAHEGLTVCHTDDPPLEVIVRGRNDDGKRWQMALINFSCGCASAVAGTVDVPMKGVFQAKILLNPQRVHGPYTLECDAVFVERTGDKKTLRTTHIAIPILILPPYTLDAEEVVLASEDGSRAARACRGQVVVRPAEGRQIAVESIRPLPGGWAAHPVACADPGCVCVAVTCDCEYPSVAGSALLLIAVVSRGATRTVAAQLQACTHAERVTRVGRLRVSYCPDAEARTSTRLTWAHNAAIDARTLRAVADDAHATWNADGPLGGRLEVVVLRSSNRISRRSGLVRLLADNGTPVHQELWNVVFGRAP